MLTNSAKSIITEDLTHKCFLTLTLVLFPFAEWMEEKYTIFGTMKTGNILIVRPNQVG